MRRRCAPLTRPALWRPKRRGFRPGRRRRPRLLRVRARLPRATHGVGRTGDGVGCSLNFIGCSGAGRARRARPRADAHQVEALAMRATQMPLPRLISVVCGLWSTSASSLAGRRMPAHLPGRDAHLPPHPRSPAPRSGLGQPAITAQRPQLEASTDEKKRFHVTAIPQREVVSGKKTARLIDFCLPATRQG